MPLKAAGPRCTKVAGAVPLFWEREINAAWVAAEPDAFAVFTERKLAS